MEEKRIVIIGCSGHYNAVLESIEKSSGLLKLTGFSKGVKDEEADFFVNEYQERYGFKGYSDYEKMLDEEKPDIAVVNSHFYKNSDIAIKAMKRGIHCYCEKPAALDISSLEEVEKTAWEHDVKYASMLEMRFIPGILTLRNAVSRGEIGEVVGANVQKCYKLGSRPEFYHNRERYGGTILWVGIHSIDMVAFATGKPLSPLFAYHSSRNTNGNGNMETIAFCNLKMGDAAACSISLDYFMPGGSPVHSDDRMRIIGTRGIVESRQGRVYLTNENGVNELPLDMPQNIFDSFIDSLLGKQSLCPTNEESFEATRLAILLRDMADAVK